MSTKIVFNLPSAVVRECTSFLTDQELVGLMPQGTRWRTLAQGDRRWPPLRADYEQRRIATAYQQGREAAPRVYLVSKVGMAALSACALVQLAGALEAFDPLQLCDENSPCTAEKVSGAAPLVFRAVALITFGSHNTFQWRTRYYYVLFSGVVMSMGYHCYQENMLLQSAALVSQSALFMVRALHLEPRVEQFCGEACGRARRLATRVSIRAEKAYHSSCGQRTRSVVRRIFAPIQPVVSRVTSLLPSASAVLDFFAYFISSKELSAPPGIF